MTQGEESECRRRRGSAHIADDGRDEEFEDDEGADESQDHIVPSDCSPVDALSAHMAEQLVVQRRGWVARAPLGEVERGGRVLREESEVVRWISCERALVCC